MLFLNSIRSRIILCIFLSTLPLIGFFIYTFQQGRLTASSHAEAELMRAAKQVSFTQEHLVHEVHDLLKVLALSRIVRQQDAAACTFRLAEIIRSHPESREFMLVF